MMVFSDMYKQRAAVAVLSVSFLLHVSHASKLAATKGMLKRSLLRSAKHSKQGKNVRFSEQTCKEDLNVFNDEGRFTVLDDPLDCSTKNLACFDYCNVSFDPMAEACSEIGGIFCKLNEHDPMTAFSLFGSGMCLPPSCGDDKDKIEEIIAGMYGGSSNVELYCDNPLDACSAEELKTFKQANGVDVIANSSTIIVKVTVFGDIGGRAALGLYLYDGGDDDQDYEVAREVIDIGEGVNNADVLLSVDMNVVQAMAAHMSDPEYHLHLDVEESTLIDVTSNGLVFDLKAGDIVVSLFLNSAPGVVNATPFAGPEEVKDGCNGWTLQCATRPYDTSNNLAHPSNGALPAVTKDTIEYHSHIHQPLFLNDGTYGNGGSWISNSAWSWLKVDLGGCGRVIDSIKFGRDRLYGYDDRDPGQVNIYVASSDNIYANGDDSMDSSEYTLVYSSEGTGFSGLIEKDATLKASFSPINARFVKVEVENPGACIDEIEVTGYVISECD